MFRGLMLATALLMPLPALAGTPTEAVAFFYSPLKYMPDIEFRERFADPAKSLFAQNDKLLAEDEEVACFDFSPAIDAQDYDEAELANTLALKETVTGDTANVIAAFSLFPGGAADGQREMNWTLKNVGGAWLVSDVESLTAKWKLSDIKCDEAL